MKRTKKTYKQSTVNAVVLILVLVLLIYLGAQLSRNFSTAVSTQRTQIITDVDYLHLRGYVFRYEAPIYGSADGIYDYTSEDGARIGVDKSYATFYPTDDAVSNQKKLDELSEKISRLDSKSASSGTVSELANIKKNLSSSYYSFINNVQNGNFPAADSVGDSLLDSLVDYKSIAEGKGGAADVAKSRLESEKAELLSSCGSGRELLADESFYFFRDADGYEEVFDPAKLENIGFDDLEALLGTKPTSYGNNVIGKRVNSAEWFLVLPTDAETVMRFKSKTAVNDVESSETDTGESETEKNSGRNEKDEDEVIYNIGMSYTITFSSMSDRESEMVLEDAYTDDKGNGYLVFSGYDMALAAELSRAQDVKINMGSETGYRIPTDALREVGEERGVYILTGTVVEFRRVTEKIKDTGNGYCIVNTYGEDRAELDEAKEKGEERERPPYLNENDLIITSGNDLYDGKLID